MGLMVIFGPSIFYLLGPSRIFSAIQFSIPARAQIRSLSLNSPNPQFQKNLFVLIWQELSTEYISVELSNIIKKIMIIKSQVKKKAAIAFN